MSTLSVKLKSKTVEGQEVWEGTVAIPGVKPTKLVRKSDNKTQFGSRRAVMTSARSLAKKIGFEGVEAS